MKATVAVDANPMTRAVQTGTEVYARELLARLPARLPDVRFVLYASRPAPGAGADLTVLPGRRLWSQVTLVRALVRDRPDLLFVPSHAVPFLAPGRALTTVHDLAFEHFPDAYPAAQRAYLRLTTRWAAQRCPVLLTVSESTRTDLVRCYGVDPARIRVAYPGIAPPGPPAPAFNAIPGRYVLHVGRIEARKNQLAALAAVERVGDLHLVCAGPVADEGLAAKLRASPRATVLGRVTDAERERLYADAQALVFPSLYEGFGFPIAEAMARGIPVVTVRTSSLPEVGGEAALYAEGPDDVEGLAEQLRRALGDASLRARLIPAGRLQAGRFTWDATAAAVAAVISELLGGGPSTSAPPSAPS